MEWTQIFIPIVVSFAITHWLFSNEKTRAGYS